MGMHQVNTQFIKAQTDGTANPMPWVSYALQQNSEEGLECDIFISHAWDEGVFQFGETTLRRWPADCEGAYMCALANPQHLDIQQLIESPQDSPFYKVLASLPKYMLIVANSNTTVHSRLWCCYEAFCAWKINQALAPEQDDGSKMDVMDLNPEECTICIQVIGNPLDLIPAGPSREQAADLMEDQRSSA